MAKVALRDVTKVYPGGVESVRRANIEIADKSFTIVVGPSGSGKSTVLRMIAGLEEITSGDLMIDGKRMNDVPPKDRDIAFVFQNYALYPHLSVYENMAFGLRLRGVPRAEIDRRVREAAALLQLEPYLERKPKALSGGQRQRVAVGRAIVRNPRVFLFDEPLSNLDAKLRVEMRTELARLHRRLGATIVYVTHDQVEAMTLGDRIVVMRDGVVQQIGAPLELYERPANRFVAGFIGSPPMNFFDATAARSNGGVFVEGEGFRLRVTPEQEAALARRGLLGKRVVFGVRPEHIHDRLFLPDAPPDRTLRAAVDVVEPMGAETYVHVRIGPRISTIRLGGESIPKEGQEMELVLEMGRTHLFDAESEETVG